MASYKFADTPKWMATFTVNPGSVGAQETLAVTLSSTFKPARVNDLVKVWAPSLEANLVLVDTVVTTAGTVTVKIGNLTATPVNPAEQVFIAAGF